ncbi:F-box only protein 6-like [Saccostrea echinata]|uniref:F-box only protein 6-like n=1 Tax=Saccostrea echinata TaxID=191078 RepID=UPI002A807C15|nr:F-box only protein 6-like [Saccostrea echinata]
MGTHHSVMDLSEVPETVLLHILSFVNEKDLLLKCSLVCKNWKRLVDTQTLWKTKCEREGYYSSKWLPLPPDDFKKYFFQNPYNRNLIKNPCALEKFDHWKIDKNGGDRFVVEDKPVGCHPLEKFADFKGSYKCWVTSYGWCEKHQIIDLVKEGCSSEVLDKIRPEVQVSEWYAARFDCKMEYHIKVELLDAESKVLDKWSFSDEKPAGRDWFQVEHIFTSYPEGLRFIKFRHKGKDQQFWAGHYGSKFTNASVRFNLQHRSDSVDSPSQVSKSRYSSSSSEYEPEYMWNDSEENDEEEEEGAIL